MGQTAHWTQSLGSGDFLKWKASAEDTAGWKKVQQRNVVHNCENLIIFYSSLYDVHFYD